MPTQLRAFTLDVDAPNLANLITQVEPEPVTTAMLYEQERHRPAGQICQRIAAVDEHDAMVGFADTGRDPAMPPGRFWLWVVVDLAARRQGIGSMLYDHALAYALEHGATQLISDVRDNCEACRRFAEQRNFTVNRHIFESKLNVRTFSEQAFAGTIENAEAAGIRFFTLTDLGDTEEVRHKFYELECRIAEDPEYAAPSFEEFRAFLFEAASYVADGQIIAASGDAWIGLTSVMYYPHTQAMYNQFTGVDLRDVLSAYASDV